MKDLYPGSTSEGGMGSGKRDPRKYVRQEFAHLVAMFDYIDGLAMMSLSGMTEEQRIRLGAAFMALRQAKALEAEIQAYEGMKGNHEGMDTENVL